MKKYKREFFVLYLVYVVIFVALSLFPSPTIGEGYRIWIFDTMYRSNLIIPFVMNTLLVLYYLYRIAFGDHNKK